MLGRVYYHPTVLRIFVGLAWIGNAFITVVDLVCIQGLHSAIASTPGL